MDSKDLEHRFSYHSPNTSEKVVFHSGVRQNCHELSKILNEILPEGREKSLAMTKLEEVMFWSNASIARGD